MAPVEMRLGRMAALKHGVQPPLRSPHAADGGRMGGARAASQLLWSVDGHPHANAGMAVGVSRHGPTHGGMALKWPHTIDRYREGSEADAASALHQEKPHRCITRSL